VQFCVVTVWVIFTRTAVAVGGNKSYLTPKGFQALIQKSKASPDLVKSIDFSGSSILVTGGTGSFGRQFIHQLVDVYDDIRIVVLSRDEHKQYDMAQELGASAKNVRFFIGDVRDGDRLKMAMREVNYVVHAAALKHVPIAEYNPFECIQTNVIGAEQVVQAAIANDVKKVIALSTDKAANPINLYGASKLASDKIFVAANHLSGHDGTRFSVVRYGNVIGSRGSVVPYFKRLIEEGVKELPITDPRMTRFWITLEQGVEFVLSCFQMLRGGEIFVPKISSMNVVDLAKAMALDLPTKVIGIRPGEKLHEVMVTSDDARTTLELPDRYVIEPSFNFWARDRSKLPGAKPVAEEFSYTSDSNTQWLDVKQMKETLRSCGY
jgi:UDP-N-acetylglucosamine 4,6-dehydratase